MLGNNLLDANIDMYIVALFVCLEYASSYIHNFHNLNDLIHFVFFFALSLSVYPETVRACNVISIVIHCSVVTYGDI